MQAVRPARRIWQSPSADMKLIAEAESITSTLLTESSTDNNACLQPDQHRECQGG